MDNFMPTTKNSTPNKDARLTVVRNSGGYPVDLTEIDLLTITSSFGRFCGKSTILSHSCSSEEAVSRVSHGVITATLSSWMRRRLELVDETSSASKNSTAEHFED